MCSHYQALKERERYRRHPHVDVGDEAVPERESLNGLFGLVPHWAVDTTITKSTYNARSETAAGLRPAMLLATPIDFELAVIWL